MEDKYYYRLSFYVFVRGSYSQKLFKSFYYRSRCELIDYLNYLLDYEMKIFDINIEKFIFSDDIKLSNIN